MRIFDIYHHLESALARADNPADPCAFRFKPEYMPAGFKCADCGAVRLFQINGGTGYARADGNQMVCYPCADVREREALKDRSRPFTAYLSSDGVTTWTGGALGKVTHRNTSRNGFHGSPIVRFHVRDVHGQWWQGWGTGNEMVCTLRAMKAPSYAKHWKG